MTKEENKALIERFPFLMPHNRFTDKIPEDFDYHYTELDAMPDGWRIAFGEQMCQEIAQAGNGMYIRVDNTNNAEKALNAEINKLAKADVETKVFTEFDEQFQVLAWIVLLLLVADILLLERKNPLFKNVKLFKE